MFVFWQGCYDDQDPRLCLCLAYMRLCLAYMCPPPLPNTQRLQLGSARNTAAAASSAFRDAAGKRFSMATDAVAAAVERMQSALGNIGACVERCWHAVIMTSRHAFCCLSYVTCLARQREAGAKAGAVELTIPAMPYCITFSSHCRGSCFPIPAAHTLHHFATTAQAVARRSRARGWRVWARVRGRCAPPSTTPW